MKILSLVITWFVVIGLIITSYLTGYFSLWVPLVVYVLVAGSRVYEKVGNHKDWLRGRWKEENIRINKAADDFAEKGLPDMHGAAKIFLQDDFERERRQAHRKLIVDMVDSLFLK
jgi:hypothetical protein